MMAIALRLTLLALVCGTALSVSMVFTKGQIAANKQQYAIQQLQSVIGDSTVAIEEVAKNIYQLKQQDRLIGHIFEITTNKGYNGEIKLWLALSLDMHVLGARVISHTETPGLGDDLDIAVSDWILSFNQQTLTSIDWRVKKDGGDFDQFTGATITPRAVVAVIHQGLESYQADKDRWTSKHEP